MAIRWMMSADNLAGNGSAFFTADASVFDGGALFDIGGTSGRNGRAALSFNGWGLKLCSTGGVAWNQSSLRLMSAIRMTGVQGFFQWRDGSTVQMECWRNVDGRLVFSRGGSGSGTIVAQSAIATVPLAPAYPHIEALCTVSPVSGVVAARINGVPVELFTTGGSSLGTVATGLNTSQSGTTAITQVGWAGAPVCDFIVADTTGSVNNSWIGDKAVRCLLPTGAGSYSGGSIAGSSPAATRWQSVNQSTFDNDTTFVSFAAAGDKATYVFGGIPASARGVVAVAPFTHLRKDDAATTLMRSLFRTSAGVDREGFDINVTTAYADYVGQIEEVDPATGAAWAASATFESGVIRNT